MQLDDYSDLRSTEAIEIPLNGKTYRAVPDPPGQLVLAMTTIDLDPDLVAKAAEGKLDESKLNREDMVKAIRSTTAQVAKQLRFLDGVLEPDSAEQWRYYFSPLPEGEYPKKARENHERHRITMPQMSAVIRALVKAYAGRPTEPPSPSLNGDGGSGQTSTAGARAGA